MGTSRKSATRPTARRRRAAPIRAGALPHAVFLQRTGPPTALEARLGQAAFLVLRLVDLVAPERRAAVSADALAYQHVATERFVKDVEHDEGPAGEAGHFRDITRQAAAVLAAGGSGGLDDLHSALFAYSVNRKDQERHDEAIDILETAWRVLRGSPGELSAAAELGRYLVWAGRLDAAAALYRWLGREASSDARLVARLGGADVLLAAHQPCAAERRYRRLLPDALRADYAVLVRDAELGLVQALRAQGRAAEAAIRAWRLHERHAAHALPELGAALEALGALEAAASVQATNALGHPQPTARWGATASLVRIAVRQDDRLAFERWRRVGERYHEDGQPSPSYELDFWLELARGAACFSGRGAAQNPLATARALLVRATAPDAAFRLRAAEVDVAEGRRPDAPQRAQPPDAELKRVINAVAAFGEPSSWATSVYAR